MNARLIETLMEFDLISPANVSKSSLSIDNAKSDKDALLGIGNIQSFDQLRHVQITEDHNRVPYRKTGKDINPSEWGQLKLFMTMLQYFTKYWDPVKHTDPKIVYVGAAPGTWWILFSEYYPTVDIHLYDPADFDIELVKYADTDSGSKIHIHVKLFGDDDVSRWSESDDVFFVSDIRTRTYDNKGEDAESKVREEMDIQRKWVDAIKPAYAQLKFKLPFRSDNGSELSNSKTFDYDYLDGAVYFQPWVGATSVECRLVSKYPHPSTSYNYAINEEIMFAHNTETRNSSITKFYNIFTGGVDVDVDALKLGIDNSWDSTCTLNIIKDYLIKTVGDDVTIEMALHMFKDIDDAIGIGAERERVARSLPFKTVRLATRKGW